MTTSENTKKIRNLTYLAIFTALVFVLQLLSMVMRGPVFSLTFIFVPVVIAVALCGFHAGPWLGFIFGVAVLITGDANAFLSVNPLATVFLVLLKGTLAGLCAAFVYRLLEKKNRYLAVTLAAVSAPIVNSGVFFIGCCLFFNDFIESLLPVGQSVAAYVAFTMIGINFFVELAVNIILVPTIYRVIEIAKKRK